MIKIILIIIIIFIIIMHFFKKILKLKNYYSGLITILFPFIGQWIGREFLIKKKTKKNSHSWTYIMMPIPGLHIIPGLMMWKGQIG